MEWITLAHLLRPQGRKGELLAELLTDFPKQLVGRGGLFLAPVDFTGIAEEARACTITETWMPKGKNEGRIVLAIAGVSSISDAEELAHFDLLVAPEHRAPLEDGAAYISDLMGCSLFDRDQLVGTIADVEFPTTPDGRRRLEDASPLLVVTLATSGEEALIPFTRIFLRSFDPAAKVLHMDLPGGLVNPADASEILPSDTEPATGPDNS